MLADNYVRHFAVLGKLCKLYDDAAAAAATQATLIAAYLDQVADGQNTSLEAVLGQTPFAQQFNNALSAGEQTRKTIALNAAAAYLTGSYFTGGLTTTPAGNGVVAVLTALATEMGAGVDDKTLTTKASTGLVNFFDAIRAANGAGPGAWNTADDESADYPDSDYVVAELVADP